MPTHLPTHLPAHPLRLQAAAFKALNGSGARAVVVADHAGSGKTLAYLAPLLQALKAEEALLGGAATQPRCPRLVVVVPTAELCAQVLRVVRALSRAGLRLRSAAATGGRPLRTQREALEGGVDVLVGTPGRLAELLQERCLKLDFCRAVVCDEVDVLLGALRAGAGAGGGCRGWQASQVHWAGQGACRACPHPTSPLTPTPSPLPPSRRGL